MDQQDHPSSAIMMITPPRIDKPGTPRTAETVHSSGGNSSSYSSLNADDACDATKATITRLDQYLQDATTNLAIINGNNSSSSAWKSPEVIMDTAAAADDDDDVDHVTANGRASDLERMMLPATPPAVLRVATTSSDSLTTATATTTSNHGLPRKPQTQQQAMSHAKGGNGDTVDSETDANENGATTLMADEAASIAATSHDHKLEKQLIQLPTDGPFRKSTACDTSPPPVPQLLVLLLLTQDPIVKGRQDAAVELLQSEDAFRVETLTIQSNREVFAKLAAVATGAASSQSKQQQQQQSFNGSKHRQTISSSSSPLTLLLYPLIFCVVNGHAQYMADWKGFQALYGSGHLEEAVDEQLAAMRVQMTNAADDDAAEEAEGDDGKSFKDNGVAVASQDEENPWESMTQQIVSRASLLLKDHHHQQHSTSSKKSAVAIAEDINLLVDDAVELKDAKDDPNSSTSAATIVSTSQELEPSALDSTIAKSQSDPVDSIIKLSDCKYTAPVLMVLTVTRGAVKARQETAIRLLHAEQVGFAIMTEASDKQLVRELMADHWGKLYPVLFCLVDGHAQYLADWPLFQRLFHSHKFQAVIDARMEAMTLMIEQRKDAETEQRFQVKARKVEDGDDSDNPWNKFTRAVSTRANALLHSSDVGSITYGIASDDDDDDEEEEVTNAVAESGSDDNNDKQEIVAGLSNLAEQDVTLDSSSLSLAQAATDHASNSPEATCQPIASLLTFGDQAATIIKLRNGSFTTHVLVVCGSSQDPRVKAREDMAMDILKRDSGKDFSVVSESSDNATFAQLSAGHVGMGHPLLFLVCMNYAKFWVDWADFQAVYGSGNFKTLLEQEIESMRIPVQQRMQDDIQVSALDQDTITLDRVRPTIRLVSGACEANEGFKGDGINDMHSTAKAATGDSTETTETEYEAEIEIEDLKETGEEPRGRACASNAVLAYEESEHDKDSMSRSPTCVGDRESWDQPCKIIDDELQKEDDCAISAESGFTMTPFVGEKLGRSQPAVWYLDDKGHAVSKNDRRGGKRQSRRKRVVSVPIPAPASALDGSTEPTEKLALQVDIANSADLRTISSKSEVGILSYEREAASRVSPIAMPDAATECELSANDGDEAHNDIYEGSLSDEIVNSQAVAVTPFTTMKRTRVDHSARMLPFAPLAASDAAATEVIGDVQLAVEVALDDTGKTGHAFSEGSPSDDVKDTQAVIMTPFTTMKRTPVDHNARMLPFAPFATKDIAITEASRSGIAEQALEACLSEPIETIFCVDDCAASSSQLRDIDNEDEFSAHMITPFTTRKAKRIDHNARMPDPSKLDIVWNNFGCDNAFQVVLDEPEANENADKPTSTDNKVVLVHDLPSFTQLKVGPACLAHVSVAATGNGQLDVTAGSPLQSDIGHVGEALERDCFLVADSNNEDCLPKFHMPAQHSLLATPFVGLRDLAVLREKAPVQSWFGVDERRSEGTNGFADSDHDIDTLDGNAASNKRSFGVFQIIGQSTKCNEAPVSSWFSPEATS